MTANERLRIFIKRRGTQEQFAASMGLSRETVSRFVAGSDPITVNFKGRFLENYGVEAYAEVFDIAPLAEVMAAAAARANGETQAATA